MSRAALAHRLWVASSRRSHRRFVRTLDDPAPAQRALLAGYLRSGADTLYGRRHGFAGIDSYEAFRERVPVVGWDDLAPWIERVRRGEPRVLTAEPVVRLVPTSGSTAARKLVPYTRTLLAEMQRPLGAWIVDLARRHPRAFTGRAYWSISPALPASQEDSAVPVGFDDDAAYLGRLGRRLAAATLAVPPTVRHVHEPDAFSRQTLLHLLAARDLTLVSVWHPSFFTLLLDALPGLWDGLLADVERRDRRRARELAGADPEEPSTVWSRLALVSAWGDGPAALPHHQLARRLPGIALQRKGLLATEAFITVPVAGARPVAVTSHFFELVDEDGIPRQLHQAEPGGEYQVLATTGGGLTRYRLGDRVRVDGFVGRTPSLTFLGRADRVSDRVGEKLSEGFVAGVVDRVLADGPATLFALLAPEEEPGRPPAYVLFVERAGPASCVRGLAGALEAGLSANPGYRWARALGQLGPARVVAVVDGHAAYLEHHRRAGLRLGDVKPAVLSPETGWCRRFRLHPLDNPRDVDNNTQQS